MIFVRPQRMLAGLPASRFCPTNARARRLSGLEAAFSKLGFTVGRARCKEKQMLKYAIIFAVISLVAALLGFGGIAAGAAGIAKLLFGLFLVLALLFVVLAVLGVGAVKKAID